MAAAAVAALPCAGSDQPNVCTCVCLSQICHMLCVPVQGGDREKKKVMKASEKFRFNFDWDNKEDTSRDLNPLYNNLHRELF